MKAVKKLSLLNYILLGLLMIGFSIALFLPSLSQPVKRTYAASATSLDYSDVMEDLTAEQVAEIQSSYAAADTFYLISFLEYCFSYDIAYSGNFGLYIYLYNPNSLTFIQNSTENKILLRVNDKEEKKSYNKYSLQFCSSSEDGTFIKFRIIDKADSSDKMLLDLLHEEKLQRLYDVSEIELCRTYGENAKAYEVGNRYIYTGFSKGYGKNKDAESTIDCFCESVLTIPEIEVFHSSYRLDGTNGTDDTQDVLTSVFFSLPNYIEDKDGELVNIKEEYGSLYAVHAEWLEAVTKPMLVTGTEEVYNGLLPYIGTELGYYNQALSYGFCTDLIQWVDYFSCENAFNLGESHGAFKLNSLDFTSELWFRSYIKSLYWMFPTDFSDNSADSYTVDSGEIIKWAKEYSKTHTNYINGTYYSQDLFESWDEKFKDETLYAYETKDLTSVTLDENWLLGLFGFTNTTTLSVPVIQEVTNCLSASQVSSEYYIDENDFTTFKDEFEREDSTLYIFHFAVDDYKAKEVVQLKLDKGVFGDYYYKKLDTNAYLAQETAYLNFDVIDVTLMNESGKMTVLGVVSSPIDIFPDATSPLETTTDFDFEDILFYLRLIVGIILGAILLFVLCTIFPPILSLFSILLRIIIMPFKFLFSLFKTE